jgi:V/A-type H+-transporting ATPase subunit A
MNEAEVFWINGPVLKAQPVGSMQMKEAVFVGEQRLAGEVIRLDADSVTVQVFEDTTGLRPGSLVHASGLPLAAELGPGMLGCMFDGIQRPLTGIAQSAGDFFDAGVSVAALDRERRWDFQPSLEPGADVTEGQTLGLVPESADMSHRVLVPPGLNGKLEWITEAGNYAIEDPLARVRTREGLVDVAMLRRWPIRKTRPCARRLSLQAPLLTGQRAIDTFFPIAKGGAASLPGGFGTGKTVLLQTVAKWSDADVIVYIGCGERGNEMADVLDEFPQLEDPRSGRKLMERTILIANTSNMPVAAREASIYTGMTIAEYFRDQGFHVALFADSISRWAEALREISGRLEELPAEEGYPAYLPTRLAEFFERSGRVQTLNGTEASLTVVGTVSPPGGDFSEPVTAHTRRYVKSFLALDRARAQARFYPAIHPLQSYSGYLEQTERWWQQHGALQWGAFTKRMLELLEEQARLEKMVKIVGRDALPPSQRLVLVCADIIVQSLLRQSAFSEADRFCSAEKQTEMLKVIELFLQQATRAVQSGVDPDTLTGLPITRRIQRMGEDIGNDNLEALAQLMHNIHDVFSELVPSFPEAGDDAA